MSKKTEYTLTLPPTEIVEVEMVKKMSVQEYLKCLELGRKKGWRVQAYQIGYRAERLQNKICKIRNEKR